MSELTFAQSDGRDDAGPLAAVVYTSRETGTGMSDGELLQLLHQARRHNSRLAISGMLLHANRRFIQLLEGPVPAVATLVSVIRADPRHAQFQVLLDEAASKRRFGHWTMGFESLGQNELSSLPGFVTHLADKLGHQSDPALSLLMHFADQNGMR